MILSNIYDITHPSKEKKELNFLTPQDQKWVILVKHIFKGQSKFKAITIFSFWILICKLLALTQNFHCNFSGQNGPAGGS